MLLGDFRVVSVERVGRLRSQPLAKAGSDFRLQAGDIHSRLEPAQHIEPVGLGLFQKGGLVQDGMVVQRNPQAGRTTVDAVTEKSRRRNANDGDGLVLNVKR